MPLSPTTVSLILGVLTVVAAVFGHWLSRRGKQDEMRQQQVAQAFEERSAAFDQVSALADRYKQDADYQRDLRIKDRDEWEARWSRQMERCRKITDTASDAIAALQQRVTPAQRQRAGAVLEELRDHVDTDHP